MSLIANPADPVTRRRPDPAVRLRAVVRDAVQAEELGFDGYGVGERHHAPYLSSSPPVVLSHIAALTSRIRLFTTVATLSLLDPVRVAEDYATLDQLSGGRLELMIGRGSGPEQAKLFGVTPEVRRDRTREAYELLRRLWTEERVTWSGCYRPPLVDATTVPRPLQSPPRIWHASTSSEESVDLAARWGDPLFSANATPVDGCARLVRRYRERSAAHGHDPAAALVGAASAGFLAARSSRHAVEAYRPVYDARRAAAAWRGVDPVFGPLEDAVERGSLLVGSPEQIVEQVHRHHEALGHQVLHVPTENAGLPERVHRESLELFVTEIAPVLRRELPSRPWPPPTQLRG